jgi:RNA polymerase sigma-70 factor (ECF subfamily)
MLGNAGDAEDAAQETFWRAYQAINRYDPARSFITWLLSIGAHYCIDQQRRRRLPTMDLDVLPEEDVPASSPSPEHEVGRIEETEAMQRLLSKLNTQDRAAIVLRYWYDFSEEEISQSLSISVSAVKSRLFRARRQLAEVYEAA